jgi:hypothetical protein
MIRLQKKREQLLERLYEDSISSSDEDQENQLPSKRRKLFDCNHLPIREAGIDYDNQIEMLSSANLALYDEIKTIDSQNKFMLEELQSNSMAFFQRSQALLSGGDIQLPSSPQFAQTNYAKENMTNLKRGFMLPLITRERENNLALTKLTLNENIQRSKEEQSKQAQSLKERIRQIEGKNDYLKAQIQEMLD